jgi:hypothetical protein
MGEAPMTWFEARLKARRDSLSRLLAVKPATKAQERLRDALVQRGLTSVGTRSHRASVLHDHLDAVENMLKVAAGESTGLESADAEVVSGDKGAMGDL